jgi:hypothetical protein
MRLSDHQANFALRLEGPFDVVITGRLAALLPAFCAIVQRVLVPVLAFEFLGKVIKSWACHRAHREIETFSTCPERDLLGKSCGVRELCDLGGEVGSAHPFSHSHDFG